MTLIRPGTFIQNVLVFSTVVLFGTVVLFESRIPGLIPAKPPGLTRPRRSLRTYQNVLTHSIAKIPGTVVLLGTVVLFESRV
jgi:hypothetical protein